MRSFDILRQFNEMQFHIVVQPIPIFDIVDAVHRNGFFLWQQFKCEKVDRNRGTQNVISLSSRQGKEIQSCPIKECPTLHVVIVDDLHFDVDEFSRIQLTGNIQT